MLASHLDKYEEERKITISLNLISEDAEDLLDIFTLKESKMKRFDYERF